MVEDLWWVEVGVMLASLEFSGNERDEVPYGSRRNVTEVDEQ
jgi:hypothetical protein